MNPNTLTDTIKSTWGGRRAGAGSGGPRPGAGRKRVRGPIIRLSDHITLGVADFPEDFPEPDQLIEAWVIGVYDDLILLHAPAEDKIYSLRLTNSDSVTLSD